MHRKAIAVALVLVGVFAFCFASTANANTTSVYLAQKTWIRGSDAMGDSLAGWSVAFGNVDGTGKEDLIIGVPFNDKGLHWIYDAGAIYVFLGGHNLDSVSTSDFDYMIYGERDSTLFGWSVAANDLDGDGYDDIIVGAPGDSNSIGKTYVIWGQDLSNVPPPAQIELCCPEDWPISFRVTAICGMAPGDSFGYAVTSCNVNDDTAGIHDLVIGAPGAAPPEGRVTVFFGDAGLYQHSYPDTALTAMDADVEIQGASGDSIGHALDCSDVDADGADDIVIGAPNAMGGIGRAYVVFGGCNIGEASPIDLESPFPPDVVRIDGTGADSAFGYSLANGDINCDAYDDIAVGAPQYNTFGGGAGRAYVFSGDSLRNWGGQTRSSDDRTFYVQGGAANEWLGECLAIGQFNGGCDPEFGCFEDLVVGAPGVADSGSAFLVFGMPFGPGPDSLGDNETGEIDIEFIGCCGIWTGCDLAMGDFDEDGADDIAIGAVREDESPGNEGGVHVVYGNLTGPKFSILQPQTGDLWCTCPPETIKWTEPYDPQGVDTLAYEVYYSFAGCFRDSAIDTTGPETTCTWWCDCIEDTVWVTVRVRDMWGNCADSCVGPFRIDTHEPYVEIVYPDTCMTFTSSSDDSIVLKLWDLTLDSLRIWISWPGHSYWIYDSTITVKPDSTFVIPWHVPTVDDWEPDVRLDVYVYDACYDTCQTQGCAYWDHYTQKFIEYIHIKPCHLNISSVDLPYKDGVPQAVVNCDYCYGLIWHIDCVGAGLSDTAIKFLGLQTNCWDQNIYMIDEWIPAKCTTYAPWCPGLTVGSDFCCDSVRLMVVIVDTVDQVDTTYSDWFMIDCVDPYVYLYSPQDTLCTGNCYGYYFSFYGQDDTEPPCSCANNSGIDHMNFKIYTPTELFIDTTFFYDPRICQEYESYYYKFPGRDSVTTVTVEITAYDGAGNVGYDTWTRTLLPYTVGPAWAEYTPWIDGSIGSYEWYDSWRWGMPPCTGLPVGDIFGRIGDPDGLCDVYLTAKNDGEFLYVAVWAPDDVTRDNGDYIILFVDENQNEVWDDDEGYYYVTWTTFYEDTIFFARHHSVAFDTISQARSRSSLNSYMHWEFKIPITRCDGFTPYNGIEIDPKCDGVMDHVGLFVEYHDEGGAGGDQGIGWWPQCGSSELEGGLYAPSDPHDFGKLQFDWKDVEITIMEPESCEYVETWSYCDSITTIKVHVNNVGTYAYSVPVFVDTAGYGSSYRFVTDTFYLEACSDTIWEIPWMPIRVGYDYDLWAYTTLDDGCPDNNEDMVEVHTMQHDALVYEILPVDDNNTGTYAFCSPGVPVTTWFVEPCDTVQPQAVIRNNGNVTEPDIPVTFMIDGYGPTKSITGYSSTKHVYNLMPDSSATVTFDDFVAACCIGTEYSIFVFTELECDYDMDNDTASASTTVLEWVAYSESLSVLPSIDGVFGPAEWDDAYHLDVTDVFGMADGYPDTCTCVNAYFKNSGDFLYVAVTWSTLCANCCVDVCDAVYLYFDDDNNDAWPAGGDRSEGYYTAVHLDGTHPPGRDKLLFTDFKIAHTDTLSDALVAFGPPTCGDCPEVVEMAIPIGSADNALNVNIIGKADTVGMHVRVFDQGCGAGQQEIGWWASMVNRQMNCPPVKQFTQVPHTWGHLVLHSGAVSCVEYTMEFDECGWYMVSLPVMPPVNTVEAVFPGACGVYTWTPAGYVIPTTIDVGVGYWVCYLMDTTISICGAPVVSYNRSLTEGWNQIGAINQTVDFSDPDDSPDGSIIDGSLNWFNSAVCNYAVTTVLEPKYGYWVAALQACNLNVSGVTAKVTPTGSDIGYGTQSAPLIWSCDLNVESNGKSSPISLKIGAATDAASGVDVGFDRPVPPSLPVVELDAWLKGVDTPFDRLATDIRGNELIDTWTVMVNSNDEFTVSWDKDVLSSDYSFMLRINGEELDMKERTSYSMKSTNGNIMNFEVVVTRLPEVFAVSQNSPNPFADGTSIKFQLPKNSHVNVSIYSITGQKISELLNKDVKAGYHTVNWDGRDEAGAKLSAGVYFYVIQAEEFRSVKKMTLLR